MEIEHEEKQASVEHGLVIVIQKLFYFLHFVFVRHLLTDLLHHVHHKHLIPAVQYIHDKIHISQQGVIRITGDHSVILGTPLIHFFCLQIIGIDTLSGCKGAIKEFLLVLVLMFHNVYFLQSRSDNSIW